MKKFLVAGIAAAAFCSSPTFAADMPVKAPPMAAAPYDPWTGCYFGGNVGGGWSDNRFPTGDLGVDGGRHTASGWAGGGQIGCDYQFASTWVVGIQGMFDLSDLTGSNFLAAIPTTSFSTKVSSFATVTGRLGYTLNPSLLLYGKAGVAWVDDRHTFLNPGLFVGSANPTRTGYDVGAGLNWMFARNWDVFVEYNYIGLGTKNEFIAPSTGGGAFNTPVKQNVQAVLVGLNYRFGGR